MEEKEVTVRASVSLPNGTLTTLDVYQAQRRSCNNCGYREVLRPA